MRSTRRRRRRSGRTRPRPPWSHCAGSGSCCLSALPSSRPPFAVGEAMVAPARRDEHPEFLGVRARQMGAQTWTHERLLDDLQRLALCAPGRVEFFDEAAARLRRAIPFDGACWHTLDPGSDLITQHRLQDLPDAFPVLADNEYVVEDVNKFAQLASADRKAATLSEATGGHPERSARFRDLLSPFGIGPELRSAFVADGATWGALIVVRRAGEPEFEERDVELFAAASTLFARAVRRGLVVEACGSGDTAEAPGVLELEASGAPIRTSSSAEALLAELSGSTAEDGIRSAAVQAVASATRAAIAAEA